MAGTGATCLTVARPSDDRVRHEPTFLRPCRNGLSWSTPAGLADLPHLGFKISSPSVSQGSAAATTPTGRFSSWLRGLPHCHSDTIIVVKQGSLPHSALRLQCPFGLLIRSGRPPPFARQ